MLKSSKFLSAANGGVSKNKSYPRQGIDLTGGCEVGGASSTTPNTTNSHPWQETDQTRGGGVGAAPTNNIKKESSWDLSFGSWELSRFALCTRACESGQKVHGILCLNHCIFVFFRESG